AALRRHLHQVASQQPTRAGHQEGLFRGLIPVERICLGGAHSPLLSTGENGNQSAPGLSAILALVRRIPSSRSTWELQPNSCCALRLSHSSLGISACGWSCVTC